MVELIALFRQFLVYLPKSISAKTHASKFDLVYLDFGFSVQAKKDKINIILDFLGTKLDTTAIKARLSPKKLQRAITLIDQMLHKIHITLKNL